MRTMMKYLKTAALALGLVLGPPLAYAAIQIVQDPNGAGGILDSARASGIELMTFLNGRVIRTASPQSVGVTTWAFDEKEYVLTIVDLGTAGDATFVVPETGVIEEISIAWNITLAGSNATMTFFLVANGGNFTNPTTLTAVSLTPLTTMTGGGKLTDDVIVQAVNRGDTIAVQTNGAPTNVVPAGVTIRIRAPAV